MPQSTAAFQKGMAAERRWFFLILLAFLFSGAPRVGQTLVNAHRENYFLHLLLSYGIGTLILLGGAIKTRAFELASLPWGFGAAVASYAGVFCTLKALESLKPQVVFPISLSGPIILGVLLSRFIFQEKIKPAGWLGIIFGILGITILAIWK